MWFFTVTSSPIGASGGGRRRSSSMHRITAVNSVPCHCESSTHEETGAANQKKNSRRLSEENRDYEDGLSRMLPTVMGFKKSYHLEECGLEYYQKVVEYRR